MAEKRKLQEDGSEEMPAEKKAKIETNPVSATAIAPITLSRMIQEREEYGEEFKLRRKADAVSNIIRTDDSNVELALMLWKELPSEYFELEDRTSVLDIVSHICASTNVYLPKRIEIYRDILEHIPPPARPRYVNNRCLINACIIPSSAWTIPWLMQARPSLAKECCSAKQNIFYSAVEHKNPIALCHLSQRSKDVDPEYLLHAIKVAATVYNPEALYLLASTWATLSPRRILSLDYKVNEKTLRQHLASSPDAALKFYDHPSNKILLKRGQTIQTWVDDTDEACRRDVALVLLRSLPPVFEPFSEVYHIIRAYIMEDDDVDDGHGSLVVSLSWETSF